MEKEIKKKETDPPVRGTPRRRKVRNLPIPETRLAGTRPGLLPPGRSRFRSAAAAPGIAVVAGGDKTGLAAPGGLSLRGWIR